MITTSALWMASLSSCRSAPCQSATRSEGEKRSSSRCQLVTTLVGATMSAESGRSSCFTASRSAMVCTVLPRPMSSASTPPDPMSWMNLSHDRPASWYGRSVALSDRGFFVTPISSMPPSFWKSSRAPALTLALPALWSSSCTRPACASGSLPPLPAAVRISISRSIIALIWSASKGAKDPSERRTYFLPSARQRRSSSLSTPTPSLS